MKTQELRKAVEQVKPGLAKKEIMEQSGSVVFRNGNLFTFNDEVAIIVNVPSLDKEITGAVPAQPLHNFLSKLPSDSDLDIKVGENELKLSSGKNRAGIRMESEIKLPMEEEIGNPEEWKKLTEEFLTSLKRVLFSASTSTHKPILTCVHITDQHMETCDGFRITRCPCRSIGSEISIVSKNLEKLPSYQPEEFGIVGQWIHFRNKNGVRYCARIVDGEYPDLDKFLDVKGIDIQFPSDLKSAVDWASIVADDTIQYDQSVTVTLSKGSMTIRGEGPDGWAEETLRIKYKGEPVSFSAHPLFLKDVVSLATEVTLSSNTILVQGEGFVHAVSLNPQSNTR